VGTAWYLFLLFNRLGALRLPSRWRWAATRRVLRRITMRAPRLDQTR